MSHIEFKSEDDNGGLDISPGFVSVKRKLIMRDDSLHIPSDEKPRSAKKDFVKLNIRLSKVKEGTPSSTKKNMKKKGRR